MKEVQEGFNRIDNLVEEINETERELRKLEKSFFLDSCDKRKIQALKDKRSSLKNDLNLLLHYLRIDVSTGEIEADSKVRLAVWLSQSGLEDEAREVIGNIYEEPNLNRNEFNLGNEPHKVQCSEKPSPPKPDESIILKR